MDILVLLWILCAAVQLACGINCTSKSTLTVTRTITMTMLSSNASHSSTVLGISSIYNGTTGVIVITGNLTNPLTTTSCAQNSTDHNALSLAGTGIKVTDNGFSQASVPFSSNVGAASEKVSTTSTSGSVGIFSSENTTCVSGTDVKSTVTLTNIMTLTSTIVVSSMNAILATNNELMSTTTAGSLFTETIDKTFPMLTIDVEPSHQTVNTTVPSGSASLPKAIVSMNDNTTIAVSATNASDSTVTQPTAFNSTGLFISFAHTTGSTVTSDPFSWPSLVIHSFQPTHVASKTTSTKTIMVTSTVSSQATPKIYKGKKTYSKQHCDDANFKSIVQDIICGELYHVLMIVCVSICLIAILL